VVYNLSPLRSIRISETFGLVYCNAVTPITDLICTLFGFHVAMFVNRIYPGTSLKTNFVSPGKPLYLVFASPRKSWKKSILLSVRTLVQCWQVEWPVNLVITNECLQLYSQIFSFMLSLKRCVWVLKQLFHALKHGQLFYVIFLNSWCFYDQSSFRKQHAADIVTF